VTVFCSWRTHITSHVLCEADVISFITSHCRYRPEPFQDPYFMSPTYPSILLVLHLHIHCIRNTKPANSTEHRCVTSHSSKFLSQCTRCVLTAQQTTITVISVQWAQTATVTPFPTILLRFPRTKYMKWTHIMEVVSVCYNFETGEGILITFVL
jgi:hypothetical protein